MTEETARTSKTWSMSWLIALAFFVLAAGGVAFAGCTWLLAPNQNQPTDAQTAPTAGVPQAENESPEPSPVSVSVPAQGGEISSPVSIEGQAVGNWFFEASFPIRVLDDAGNVLGTGIATAQSDWMTENFVPFSATIEFVQPITPGNGKIVFQRDNPSGLPEHDRSFELPVRLAAAAETTSVKAFFSNNRFDPEISCNKVFPVERRVSKTAAVGRAALQELLLGPSEAERADGYYSSINSGVKINSLVMDDGVARVDFDSQMEYQVGGSCRVGAIRAQVTETLKQFSTVRDVIISVEGRVEDALQP